MTLVAVRVEDDYAEILTDTFAIADFGFFRVSKIDVQPQMDAAISGRGPSDLIHWWRWWRDGYGDRYSTLDDLVELAPQQLPNGWAERRSPENAKSKAGEIYHVGWSQAAGRFVGVRHGHERGFQAESLPGFVVAPAVGDVELDAPSSDSEWIAVGEHAYTNGGCSLGSRSPFGGDLILTRLERGSVTQRRIHTLPQNDWRFRQMLIGTTHPVGQLGPCTCGSGLPYIRCHLAPAPPTWPCPCPAGQETGVPFYDCHRVDPDAEDSRRHWREHAEDFERTREPLRALWLDSGGADVDAQIAALAERRTAAAASGRRPSLSAGVSRNAPCPCGSGAKHKKCCLPLTAHNPPA